MIRKYLATALAATSALFSAQSAFATQMLLEAVPTAWRLQDYLDNTVTLYFTGSPCILGGVDKFGNATAGGKSRQFEEAR